MLGGCRENPLSSVQARGVNLWKGRQLCARCQVCRLKLALNRILKRLGGRPRYRFLPQRGETWHERKAPFTLGQNRLQICLMSYRGNQRIEHDRFNQRHVTYFLPANGKGDQRKLERIILSHQLTQQKISLTDGVYTLAGGRRERVMSGSTGINMADRGLRARVQGSVHRQSVFESWGVVKCRCLLLHLLAIAINVAESLGKVDNNVDKNGKGKQ